MMETGGWDSVSTKRNSSGTVTEITPSADFHSSAETLETRRQTEAKVLSSECMANVFIRDFPYGLSLEPIQTRNLLDYNNSTSRV